MPKPSAHLTWKEVACNDGTPYPSEWRKTRLLKLVKVFEDFRAYFGNQPLVIGSCYRTPSWNRKQGGASKSQHLQGRAIDIHCPKNVPIKEFRQRAKLFANENKNVGGLGWYRWGVHLDIRPHKRLAFWNMVKPGVKLHDSRSRRA